MSETAETPSPTTARNPGVYYAMFATLVAGIGAAIYLVQHKLRITLDPTYQSSCNVSSTVNCDTVNTSDASEVFGLPISLFAIPTYLVLAYLARQAMVLGKSDAAGDREAAFHSLSAAAAVGVSTVLYSVYLAWYSATQVGSICLYCTSLYVVNLVFTGLALYAGPKKPGTAISASLKALADLKPPVLPALGVLVIAGGVSWVGYDMTKDNMEIAYMASIDTMYADFDAMEGEGADTASAEPVAVNPAPARAAGAAASAQPAAVAATGDKPPRRLPDPKSAVRKGQKTKDGWPYFETPFDEPNEFWAGNPDAKVTVVKYADFQCGYCKYLASTMKPLKKKFGEDVRFVMKHFPMNPKCNRAMQGYDKHPYACEAAYAGHCAGMQDKFWEYHDLLYDRQKQIDGAATMVSWAGELGMDTAAFQACMDAPETVAAIKNDIEIGLRAGLYGTPRTYINSRMVTGSASKSILEYHLQRALKDADKAPGQAAAPKQVVMAPKPDGKSMIQASKAGGTFFIDPYEASVTTDGVAVSQPGLEPARVSWFEAEAACKAAGKRMCTEEEWVSACSGEPAVDDNKNTYFADDAVEGNMYPYGPFHEAGNCQDQADKYEGRALKTGAKPKCRTPAGVFDQAGNIGEWVGLTEKNATSMGGHASTGERAACNQRSSSSGAGRRNHTTGFRCCADADVTQSLVDPDDIKPHPTLEVGKPVPAFSAESVGGQSISSRKWAGKVTLVNFFASWCGPCKKEMPFLVKHAKEYAARGFQIVGIGVDSAPGKSSEFAKSYGVNFPVIEDTASRLMGEFGVYSMPATFIVDREGVIQYMDTGFKPEEQAAPLKRAIEANL